MQDFTILANGRLGDATVLETMAHMRSDIPDMDDAAVESHFMLFRAYHTFYSTLAARYDELGISISRFRMLLYLYNKKSYGANSLMTMSELGAGIEASVPNVVRMVQSLEATGWVRRVENPTDRRVTFVGLTDGGLARFRSLLPKALQIWKEVWSGLSIEEKAHLNHLLAKLRISLLSRYVG